MSTFTLAVRAQLPIIGVQTNDIVNISDTLEHICETPVQEYRQGSKIGLPGQSTYFWYTSDIPLKGLDSLYREFTKNSCTLIIVNHKPDISVYDAGSLPIPRKLIYKFLVPEYMDKETANEILPALGGLTLREVAEVLMITQAREGGVDVPGVVATRQEYGSNVQGLELVSTNMKGYVPDEALQQVAQFEKEFFLGNHDIRLRPRGILANGPAGTGKSSAAKYIAREWGVPLFRLDATIQSKWVGSTEENLRAALSKVEALSPAVLMVDECEKLFSEHDGSGVTTKMLGSLLWWLQEHQEKVFTFMTCNDMTHIPKELYRPGRIDRVMTFKGLTPGEAADFCNTVLRSFKAQSLSAVKKIVEVNFPASAGKGDNVRVPHAKIYSDVIKHIKLQQPKGVDSDKKNRVS